MRIECNKLRYDRDQLKILDNYSNWERLIDFLF